MLFAIVGMDTPNGLDLRLKLRPEHRGYLEKMADRLAFAGPLLADDGKTMIGSLVVADFESRAEVQKWLAEEPYAKGGVFRSIGVHPYRNLWPQKVGFPEAYS